MRISPQNRRVRFARACAARIAVVVVGSVTTTLAVVALAPATASAASFGVEKWEAGTCNNVECKDEGSHELFYTQAAGHPKYGITMFRMNSETDLLLLKRPIGHVENVRVDIPPGLAVNPDAVPQCTQEELESSNSCPADTKVGEDDAEGAVGSVAVKESFPVYNMVPHEGEPARFAIDVKSATLDALGKGSISYLETGISWYDEPETAESSGVKTGDYHEFFKIKELPTEPEIIESKLIFWGVPAEENGDLAGTDKAFLTMPSECKGPETSYLHVDSYEEPSNYIFEENPTPVGASGCGLLAYKPEVGQKPETAKSDASDGTEVDIHIPQATETPSEPNSPDLETATVTLPEGMTLNPSAANGLETCSSIGIGTNDAIKCPEKSVIGTVSIDAPGIPNGSLNGEVYLGTPEAGKDASSGGMYRIFVAAEAKRYGVGLRLEGRVSANESTGRLETTFTDLPDVPFENFDLKFKGGSQAPLANPLQCGEAITSGKFTPYSGEAPATPSKGFLVEASGGGACSGVPFSPSGSTSSSTTAAGANTSFTLNLTRPEGDQYVSQVSVSLPEGLVGEIPAVPLCDETEAAAGSCPSSSQIGTASVTVGSGKEPYALSGSVYLTGPYDGAPYGLLVVTNAEKVGPYDYGLIDTRAKIEINPSTARVTVSATLPTIVGGAPLRLRSIGVDVDHPDFLINPTSCASLATNTTLGSTLGASSAIATPFQATGCSSLAFKPTLTATSNGKTTHKVGASLAVTVTQPEHSANIHAVDVILPKKLGARDSTLNKACLKTTFEAKPSSCPSESKVGTATVKTPVLPGQMSGTAYLVSLGHAGFPNLDIVLEGDGVTIVLVGATNIKGEYTHSNFESLPDVPFSSFSLSLHQGLYSALGTSGDICKGSMKIASTIVAQSGATVKQKTKVNVTKCPAKKKRKKTKKKKHRAGKKQGKAKGKGNAKSKG